MTPIRIEDLKAAASEDNVNTDEIDNILDEITLEGPYGDQ